MLKRHIDRYLMQWAKQAKRKPLLLRGARQVGKTSAVKQLGKTFEHFISINLELETEFHRCFQDLAPQAICNAISFIKGEDILPGKTLLFIDEIQAYPKAITALRYFYEDMPDLHVIGAGSLLEFTLNHEHISVPVGRVEYLHMGPCSVNEYLDAILSPTAQQQLAHFTLQSPPPEVVHQTLLKHVQNFMIVGGMPEALAAHIEQQDWSQIQRIQNAILQTYRDDFGKYASLAKQPYLQTVFQQAPGMVGQQIQYKKIDPDARARELKQAIVLLEYAGLVKRIFASNASGLPLRNTLNEKKFKWQFLDVGLVQRALGIEAHTLLQQDMTLINQGALAEQLVGQLLLSQQDPYTTPELYFWARDARGSQAEVDFLTHLNGSLMPLEVKSSAVGHLKSLKHLMAEKQLPLGIKISSAPLAQQGDILNIPFYLLHRWPELVQEALGNIGQ